MYVAISLCEYVTLYACMQGYAAVHLVCESYFPFFLSLSQFLWLVVLFVFLGATADD